MYYHRGLKTYAKYSPARDRKIIAKHPPAIRLHYQHTGDMWAGVWRAEEMAKAGRMKAGLKRANVELGRITNLAAPELKVFPHPTSRILGRGIGRGVVARGYYIPEHRDPLTPSVKTPSLLAVAEKGAWKRRLGRGAITVEQKVPHDPFETLFHEFGHHIQHVRKKPIIPTRYNVPKQEAIAKSFGRLYAEKIKTKKLTI